MTTVRVRFAPSPTGFFHIGGARTALFNWLYARHTGGQFVLRIEDTDAARNTDEALRVLLDGMRWLGLDWDEGPEVGGDRGPYFQSQRAGIYARYRDQLRDAGRLYEKDGALWFRVEGARETVFDDYRKREVEKVKATPQIVEDHVRGRVERVVDEDFVVFRANGEPVFHFVNVVDDIEMGITHVIRGEDHLSNTPKHQELYQALGVPFPQWAHIPLILKQDGPGKMSKRDRGALIEEYQENHYLAAAVRNYLALLGWNPKNDREIMPLDELIAAFSLEGIGRDNARFDPVKLAHFNAAYLRDLPLETYAHLASPILVGAGLIDQTTSEDYLQRALALAQPKVAEFNDLPGYIGYFFTDDFPIDEKNLAKQRKKGDPAARLAELIPVLQAVPSGSWDADTLQQAYDDLAARHEQKPFAWFPITRLAVSGQGGGPDLLPLLEALGKERVVARLEAMRVRLEANAG